MKLSIITVCLNSAATINTCIKSVLALDSKDYEYIIIDGLSTDKTVHIASKYIESFKRKGVPYTIISEHDTGIYNAMNKAINIAKGKWIIYMNSDDVFYSVYSINSFIGNNYEDYDVVYGDVVIKNNNQFIFRKAKDITILKTGIEMPFCHQSTYTKRAVLEKYMFDEDYSIIADMEMYLRIYEQGGKFIHINEYISVFSNEGLSQTNRIRSLSEGKRMLQKHNLLNMKRRTRINIYFIYYCIKAVAKYIKQRVYNC
ncbi:MAG: glycosyltransferase family 2 protein [Thomasclavelia spiroformis]|uniref:glycosyltransferase family 2 protein n=1 Tax=Thomasclavelia spiroformis TaxID=29348 RepID=UPI0039905196